MERAEPIINNYFLAKANDNSLPRIRKMEVFIMNKLVKKSLAGILAGVMAATSLVGSISAMAITNEAINGIKPAALNQKVTFEKAAEGAQETVYSFTTAKATDNTKKVKYVIDFSSDAVVLDAASKKRVDSCAELVAYELDKDDKVVTDVAYVPSFSGGPTTKTYFVDTDGVEQKAANLKSEVYSYNDGSIVVELKEETTYAFTVETFGWWKDETEKEASKQWKSTKAYMTISNYVEAPAAKFVTTWYDDAAQDITRTAKNKNGTYYMTVVDSPVCEVQYIGTDADIVVPDVFEGRRVAYVDGTNSNEVIKNRIRSLTLGKNVRGVYDFADYASLSKVTFNDGLEVIGEEAFYNDALLTGELVLPASVKSIGKYAFYNTNYDCAKITNVDTTIAEGALGIVEVPNEATANPYDTKTVVKDGFFITAPAKAAKVAAYGKALGIDVIDPAACTHIYGEAVVKKATYWAKGSETKTCKVCGAVDTKTTAQKKVAISTVKSAKKGQITVKTKSVDAAIKGYKIQVATKKDFSNAKTIKVATTKKALSKTITGLKAGKKYYVRVRVYKSGKNGAWSAKKAVTVKK
jgi:hypothetical protein